MSEPYRHRSTGERVEVMRYRTLGTPSAIPFELASWCRALTLTNAGKWTLNGAEVSDGDHIVHFYDGPHDDWFAYSPETFEGLFEPAAPIATADPADALRGFAITGSFARETVDTLRTIEALVTAHNDRLALLEARLLISEASTRQTKSPGQVAYETYFDSGNASWEKAAPLARTKWERVAEAIKQHMESAE